jgi:hypothetical protein
MPDIRIREDPAHPEGGHAVMEVTGIAGARSGRFRLYREGYVHGNLGPGGWQVAETLLEPERAEPLGDGIRLYVGPELVRWLESGPVMVALPEAGFEATAFWPDIAPLHEEADGARRFAAGDPRARPAPPPRAPQPSPEPAPVPPARPAPSHRLVVEPEPRPRRGESAPLRRGYVVIAALVVLSFLVGAAAWWYLAPHAPPATAAAPPNLLAMSAGDIIRQAKSPQEIDAAAREVQQAGDYDKALVLFEEAALRGNAPSNTALAHLYDPNGFQPDKPFKNPDMRQAARYYKAGEEGGDEAARAPRAALKETLAKAAAQGNVTAQTALKDFW